MFYSRVKVSSVQPTNLPRDTSPQHLNVNVLLSLSYFALSVSMYIETKPYDGCYQPLGKYTPPSLSAGTVNETSDEPSQRKVRSYPLSEYLVPAL